MQKFLRGRALPQGEDFPPVGALRGKSPWRRPIRARTQRFPKARSEWGEKGRRALRLAGGNRRTLCVGGAAVGRGFPTGGRSAGKRGRRLDGGDVELKALLLNASPKNNGNTARLLELIGDAFQKKGMETQTLCLGDLHYAFCKGYRSCYQTAECVQHDDVQLVLEQMEQADLIAIASPDYWGGITGQLKAFIDRCTPYSPAHQPHAALSMGKRGISIALSAREDPRECKEILARIDRFFQRMGIRPMANYYTCGVLTEDDLNNNEGKLAEVTFFGEEIAKTLVK